MVTLKALSLGLLASPTFAINYTQPYRPQFHFSPTKNWMNDPAGLIYHNGNYHLYFQYNPGGIEWGNMSWGHATSDDLTHWQEQPVALLARGFPDNVTEMFFTGSAVADEQNTSGFGAGGKTPLVALYTSYYPIAQTLPSGKEVKTNQQSQSLAYSLDDGTTWTTYDAGNPVIHNPPSPYEEEYQNFRDPFVFWHAETRKWIMVSTLAGIHKLALWTSDNLKDWSHASFFGPFNAVGGVWECPNLFPLDLDSSTKWVMVMGLNPGGPPGTVGSGTQYFIGDFDGTTFVPDEDSVYEGNKSANWMDWGPDFYAAASYNGLDERMAVGWMNNWQYGEKIPTYPWRSAMSTPRQLSLKTIGGKPTLIQRPHAQIQSIEGKDHSSSWKFFEEGTQDLGSVGKTLDIELSFSASNATDFGIIVQATPDFKEQTKIGYNFTSQMIFVDRRNSGESSFDGTFASIYHAPLAPSYDGTVHLRILVDWSSVEVFGGQGETTLTAQIFPDRSATFARLFSNGGGVEDVKVDMKRVSSIWN
ncbi:Extracellular exo-inulinase inuE [Penicillium argentinense]|uniref:fructan beta-fructosidase n=1 Tax=Penicillium argentinense TaxID=1131581 RepID=A0A9W9FFU6_9EURO|nr:Extracellular exo-inulinase inuE [Penicillium argentinense]KAJ5099371.1 Extracellular exo-inulinase inuE [Penicillium argentinense]